MTVGRKGHRSPVRTCVGCQARTITSELLRVVLAPGDTAKVIPDEQGRLAGRGAHVHPTHACLGQAERRRAFPRALRVPGPVDLSALRLYLDKQDEQEAGRSDS